jgi:hypothetical protein
MDVLFKESMEKFDGVADEDCQPYIARKMLAWYTKFPPKKNVAAANADDLPPTSLSACCPEQPEPETARPSRGMALSDDEGAANM